MRIERVRSRIVAVPLDEPLMTTLGPVEHSLYLAVDIEADGLLGVGYGWALREPELRALQVLVSLLGEECVGREAGERDALRRDLERGFRWSGRGGLALFALGIVDMCLWDLAGNAAEQPLWQLLGGSPEPVSVYASGLFLSADRDEMLAEAQRYLDAGYRGVKMRVGTPEPADDIERVAEVKALLDPSGVDLMVDAGLDWTGRDAVDRSLALAELDLHWIEDPVDYREGACLDQLAAIRRASRVPICAGEFLAGVEPFEAMAELGAADYLNVDLLHVGGVTPWLEVADIARRAGLTPVTHMFPEVAVHVAAREERPHAIEYVPGWSTKLFADAEVPRDGLLTPPPGPGLGVSFDWSNLDAWALGSAEEVTLAAT